MAWSLVTKMATDPTKCGTADSTNFPMLVSGTYGFLATAANGGLVTNTSGYDIGFYADAGLTTKLNWETELYTAATGQVVYWVQIPTLSHSVPTNIWMAVGNAAVTTDQSNPRPGGSGWLGDTNFKGVWHLGATVAGGSTINPNDSTSNANNGTLTNTPTDTAGQLGGAAHFVTASIQKITIAGDPASLKITGTMSVSFWAKFVDGNVYGYINKNDDNQQRNFGTWTNGGGSLMNIWQSPNSSAFYGLSHAVPSNAMHHWVFVIDPSSPATTVHGYLDGVADTGFSVWINTWSGTTLNNPTLNWTFGDKSDGSWAATADIDEVRISNSIRNADWIKAEYNNQSNPATFYSFDQGFGVGDSGWNGGKHFIVGNGMSRSEWAN